MPVIFLCICSPIFEYVCRINTISSGEVSGMMHDRGPDGHPNHPGRDFMEEQEYVTKRASTCYTVDCVTLLAI